MGTKANTKTVVFCFNANMQDLSPAVSSTCFFCGKSIYGQDHMLGEKKMKLTKRGRIVLLYIPGTIVWLILLYIAGSMPGTP